MPNKSFMFLVQGEGRGHITQAISVYEMLKQHQMELCCVVVGSCGQKKIPAFVSHALPVPLVCVASPGFIKDRRNKSVSPAKTMLYNLLRIRSYAVSLKKIHKLIEFHRPDVIINFYEPLAALFQFVYPRSPQMISIAHQFIYLHPHFRFPQSHWLKKKILRSYTRFVSFRSSKILAISMYNLPGNHTLPMRVVPPLIRSAIRGMEPERKNFILVYLVNSGYQQEIIHWHHRFPEISLHCFTDCAVVRDEKKGEWKIDDTLSFHSLNDKKFMEMMATCNAVATTAGFESVCEAMYLAKPVMMVPVQGQFEQYCNAEDAQKTGAGFRAVDFDLSKLVDYLKSYQEQHPSYRLWVQKSESMMLDALSSF